MTRETSKAVYDQIKAEGLLSQGRWEVYSVLFTYGPLTARELGERLPMFNCWTRLTELRDRGVVYERQERQCSVTGRMVIEWDVTDGLPHKVTSKNKKRDRMAELLRGVVEASSRWPVEVRNNWADWLKQAHEALK